MLRVEDLSTGRHAFLGLGFQDRSDSFDFNVALTDHEKRVEAKRNPLAAAAAPFQHDDGKIVDDDEGHGGATFSRKGGALPKVDADFSLRQGQKIHVNISKPANLAKGGFLSSGAANAAGAGFLPPPPAAPAQPLLAPPGYASQPAVPSFPLAPTQPGSSGFVAQAPVRPTAAPAAVPAANLLGFDDWGTGGQPTAPTGGNQQQQQWFNFE